MAAFALQPIAQTRYYIRLDSSAAATETDQTLLLGAAQLHTDSQTAVIYGFQPETSELTGVKARTSIAARVKEVGVTLSAATSRWVNLSPAPSRAETRRSRISKSSRRFFSTS